MFGSKTFDLEFPTSVTCTFMAGTITLYGETVLLAKSLRLFTPYTLKIVSADDSMTHPNNWICASDRHKPDACWLSTFLFLIF